MTDDDLPFQVRLGQPRRWQGFVPLIVAIVMVLLSIAVLSLVLLSRTQQARMDAMSRKLDESSAQAALERDVILSELAEANMAIARRDRQVMAKDAEISRLNALLLAAHVDPGHPVPGSEPEPSHEPTASPSPTAGPSPSPSARPPPPSPSPSPTPAPSPSPSPCLLANPLPIGPACILPRPDTYGLGLLL